MNNPPIDKGTVNSILSRKLSYRDQQRAARLLNTRVFTSPGADGTRQPLTVQFTGHTLALFEDGSLRNVPRRRRLGISGRQLRMLRKAQRREMKRAAAQATPPAVVG